MRIRASGTPERYQFPVIYRDGRIVRNDVPATVQQAVETVNAQVQSETGRMKTTVGRWADYVRRVMQR